MKDAGIRCVLRAVNVSKCLQGWLCTPAHPLAGFGGGKREKEKRDHTNKNPGYGLALIYKCTSSHKSMQSTIQAYLSVCCVQGSKNPGFFKKAQPSGFGGFIGFWGFIGFFWTSRKK